MRIRGVGFRVRFSARDLSSVEVGPGGHSVKKRPFVSCLSFQPEYSLLLKDIERIFPSLDISL